MVKKLKYVIIYTTTFSVYKKRKNIIKKQYNNKTKGGI